MPYRKGNKGEVAKMEQVMKIETINSKKVPRNAMLEECEDDDSSKEDDVEENDKPCGPGTKICNFSELDQFSNPAVKKMLDYTRSYMNQVKKDTMLEADSEAAHDWLN